MMRSPRNSVSRRPIRKSVQPLRHGPHRNRRAGKLLRNALELELAVDLAAVRARQNYLRRELDRVNSLANYEHEFHYPRGPQCEPECKGQDRGPDAPQRKPNTPAGCAA